MKLQYQYSYNTILKISVGTAILTGLFFIGFGLLSVGPLIRATPGTSDFYLFLGLLIVFAGFGIILAFFAIFFHVRMRGLIKSSQWFGITADRNTMISEDFNIFGIRRLKLKLETIESNEVRLYRGNEFLHLNTKGSTFFLPIYRLSATDKKTLLANLASPELFYRQPLPITKADLEIAAALVKTFQNVLELRLKETLCLTHEGSYTVGFDPNFPKLPHLKLSKSKGGGDSYSGHELYRNEFELLYFQDEKKRLAHISLVEVETDLNGYSLEFYFDSNISADRQKLISDTFHHHRQNPLPLPESFFSFLNSQS